MKEKCNRRGGEDNKTCEMKNWSILCSLISVQQTMNFSFSTLLSFSLSLSFLSFSLSASSSSHEWNKRMRVEEERRNWMSRQSNVSDARKGRKVKWKGMEIFFTQSVFCFQGLEEEKEPNETGCILEGMKKGRRKEEKKEKEEERGCRKRRMKFQARMKGWRGRMMMKKFHVFLFLLSFFFFTFP